MVIEKEYILLLGGNHPNTRVNFIKATEELNTFGHVKKLSSIYESEAWGFDSEHKFKNQALIYKTEKEPIDLLDSIHEIEKKLGRIRQNNGYEDRGIDIDILFFESNIIDLERLKIPHPLLHERAFTLEPLNEIASEFKHPIIKKSIKSLLLDLKGRKTNL